MTSSSPPSWCDKLRETLQSEHFEVTLRLGLNMFLGYVLTFANISWITPIETNILLGILVPFCTMLFPTLMFTFGSLILPLFSVFLFVFLSSSALLAIAASFGTGAFVAMFALWCFWVTFTRWDKVQGNKTSIILIGVVFQTVLVWPTFLTVQYGVTIPDPNLPPSVQNGLMELVADVVQTASLIGIGTHDILINDGALKGQIASVTITEDGSGNSSTFLNGGMWIVKGAWTFQGTNNPFATYSNFFLWVFWLVVILSIGVVLPPFRTMRSAVWRGIIPAAMKDSAMSIRLHVARMKYSKSAVQLGSNEVEGGKDSKEEEENVSDAKRFATRGKCIYHINALFAGTLAKYTALEPRLLDFKPSQWTTAILVQLSEVTSRCVRIAVGIELLVYPDDEQSFLHHHTDQYLETAEALETCAVAIQTGNKSLLDTVEEKLSKVREDEPKYDPFDMKTRITEVLTFSKKWLEAMDINRTHQQIGYFAPETIHAFKQNFIPWYSVQISHYVFLYGVIKSLFDKSTWTNLVQRDSYALTRAIWCFKYTIGMTSLLAMSIYWSDYRQNFVVAPEDDPKRMIYSLQNGSWTLVAYCFATTQTAEGSIKKGILRMLGTIVGALSGWLALVVCEDASFKFDYNTYGIVVWLTISSMIATYVATERGFAARISLSNDYAFGPIYFVLTQVIIVCYAYFYFGPDSKGILTVNRMIANLVGILMAMVLSIIPPANWGGDPGHCRSMVRLQFKTVQEVLHLLLSCKLSDETDEPLEEDCQQVSNKLGELRGKMQQCISMQIMTTDYEKDASKLQSLPILKVDPRLKLEIAKVTRDIHITAFLPQLAMKLLSDKSRRNTLLGRDGTGGRQKLESIASKMENQIVAGDADSKQNPTTILASDADVDLELFIRTINWLLNEMEGHDKALSQIKF